MSLTSGDPAPIFTLPTDEGTPLTLSSLIGKRVILYFYPKDATSGCTAEACAFRDEKSKFDQKNAVIIGISKDSIKNHKNFKEKEGLNFILVSDEEGEVCKTYGVWVEKSMYGKKYFGIERTTFLINEDGFITKIWKKVKVPGHIKNVLEAL